jgi:hypothetical protein
MGQALSKHPGGRPSIYSRAVLDTTQDYITNYENHGHSVPTIAGLCQVIGMSRDLAYKWMEDESKKEFFYMVSRIMTAQEHKLIEGGLNNTYNSSVTKLMLSKHGYTDSQDKQGVSVNVTINRGSTEIEVKGQTLTIDNDA